MDKTKSFLILITVIVLTSVGCNKLENLLDVKFDAEYAVDLEAIIPPSPFLKQTSGTFSASATINPSSNAEFSIYADKIKEIKINSISAKVLSISKPVTITMANISVSSDTKSTSWNFANEIITVGKTLTLGNSNNQWAIVEEILEGKNIFTVLIDGETDVDDVTFTLEVTLKTKVTANPLED